MPADLTKARDLFLHAVGKLPPEEWDRYVVEACGGDAELAAQVRHLLKVHREAGSFLDRPAAGVDDGGGGTARQVLERSSAGGTIDDPADGAGTIIAGRYKLLQQVGEGGMGTVWMAEQTEPVKRRVAVKLIRVERGQSKTILSRFEAERQAIALMDHPHIARLLDAGEAPAVQVGGAPRPFFVMELVKGVPLTEFCDAHKLGLPERLRLFVQVCAAVQHAHQKGVIHRDLKPSNVLVESHDGKPVPKVIDFGLAKATTGLQLSEHTLFTAFGTVMGTPLYMAPEQAGASAVDVDTRADIYALGIILYELLTGSTPITRDTLKKAALDEMLKLIREQDVPTPSSRLSSADGTPGVAANRQTEPAKLGRFVKGELDWIVLKALAKERDRRYETASGFARDVERFLNHEPVSAGPPSAAYRLRKFARRNKGGLAVAAVIVFILVVGIVGTTWGMMWALQARRAEAERAEGERTAKQEALAAAAAEKAAREQAQKRLAQIERGVELFAGMLKGISPRAEEKGGEPLYQQLRRKAEQAAAELDGDVVGDPQAVARLQTILGNTLRGLGSYATAVTLLEKARATRERELGADHPDTLTTLNNLAGAYQDAGRLPESIPLFERVRDVRVAKLGPDHPSTLSSINNLAGAYQDVGRLPEAIRLYEQVRDGWVAKRGSDHPSTLTALNNLAGAYVDAGKLSEAIRLYEQVRDGQVAKRGADHADTLTTQSYLAQTYQLAGKLPEAIRLLETVRDAQVAKLGAEHPDTLTTLQYLAGTYRAAGKLPEAIRLLETVRDAQVAKLGAEHPDTIRTVSNLALAYQKSGRQAEAIRLFETVRDANVAKLGADHPSTLTALNHLAGAYQDSGKMPEAIRLYERAAEGFARRNYLHAHAGPTVRNTVGAYEVDRQFDKAEAWQRRWLAHVKEQAGPQSPAYADEMATLGSLLLKQEKWADAATTLAECLALCEKAQPDGWTTFNTQSLLGGALLGQKNYAAAEPLLLKGYAGMKQREKTIPPQGKMRLPQAVDRLIDLFTVTNRPEEAKKWQAERAKYAPEKK
jgi:serine/threonine protein kinase/tetratricopeptide (TPR) repeat protein